MKVKGLISIVISIIIIFILSLFVYNTVLYYDLESFLFVGVPLLLVIRFADLAIRDFITNERHKQVLVSTFITTLVLIILFVASYFVYTSVLQNMDIFKTIIETFNITPLLKYVK